MEVLKSVSAKELASCERMDKIQCRANCFLLPNLQLASVVYGNPSQELNQLA
jgi:hypothetical protein